MTNTIQTEAVSGVEIFVPLNKLKKSPKNARKVPHGEAAIEALAATFEDYLLEKAELVATNLALMVAKANLKAVKASVRTFTVR